MSKIIIPLEGKSKARPRFNHRTKTAYKAKGNRIYESQIATWLRFKHVGKPIPEGVPVAISATFYFRKGKSVKRTYHTTKPDLDNLIKSLMDAANGILWHDDKQIISVQMYKLYTDFDSEVHLDYWAVGNERDKPS